MCKCKSRLVLSPHHPDAVLANPAPTVRRAKSWLPAGRLRALGPGGDQAGGTVYPKVLAAKTKLARSNPEAARDLARSLDAGPGQPVLSSRGRSLSSSASTKVTRVGVEEAQTSPAFPLRLEGSRDLAPQPRVLADPPPWPYRIGKCLGPDAPEQRSPLPRPSGSHSPAAGSPRARSSLPTAVSSTNASSRVSAAGRPGTARGQGGAGRGSGAASGNNAAVRAAPSASRKAQHALSCSHPHLVVLSFRMGAAAGEPVPRPRERMK